MRTICILLLAFAFSTGYAGQQVPGEPVVTNQEKHEQNSTVASSVAMLEQAILLEMNGEYGRALRLLKEVVSVDQENVEAYTHMAAVYIQLGRFGKALKAANIALNVDSSVAEVHNHKGIALYYLNRYTQADNEYTRAITLKSDYATAYFNRGILRYELDDRDGAYRDLMKAKELNYTAAEDALKYFAFK